MKIAVTSKGNTLDSEVDPRFGRAEYILVVDSETFEVSVIDNSENKNAFKGAGIQAASKISELKSDVLLTGYCGPNAFTTLEAAGIKACDNVSGTVRQAVEDFKNGKYSFLDAPNAEGQWT
ncbi:MAG: NifB/NifX family molybdenum-iron cluster-binding protein [Desulfobacteraceae bacterium]|nr:NifB/NifX family molybdenum-iron cluster-binding protein [Desulfobacteraceae bacterium]MCB9495215.1 NifB/NifX family molybdenum-iron cluster-binding protein [Desulfobacteraceae bacterium]